MSATLAAGPETTGALSRGALEALRARMEMGGPAYAVDLEDRIIAWNDAAERLFGWRADEMVGRRGWEILHGHDAFGNAYCGSRCPLRCAAAACAPLQPFALDLASGEETRKKILVHVEAVLEDGAPRALVHRLEPTPLDALFDGVRAALRVESLPPVPGPRSPLTPRETQILRLLAEGVVARDVARRLGISRATVRNHVQNILRKVEVHGRVEAVSVALKNRWI